MPLLALPLALIALSALPTIAAVYWLRNRYRRQAVSSLALWVDQTQAREGGRKLEKLQTPLLFFLELAVLAIAATDPRVLADQVRRPLVVILDDSFSMLATDSDGKSARDLAIEALEDELSAADRASLRLVLAGRTPQLLGDATVLTKLTDRWTCQSTSTDLPLAIAMAGEISRGALRVLVLTDQSPLVPPVDGRLVWWSFGNGSPNIAIVNAARSATDQDEDRLLLEVANLSKKDGSTTLTVDVGRCP